MATCCRCGDEFDLTHAKRVIGGRFGAGVYDDYYPDGDVCEYCASDEIGTDYNAGAEIMEYARGIFDD